MTTPQPYTPASLPKAGAETAVPATGGFAAPPAPPGPPTSPTSPTPKRGRGRRWVWPAAVVVALLIGVAIGGGGASSDPTTSEQYIALAGERDELRGAVDAAVDRADEAEAEAARQVADLDEREGALDERQAEVEGHEADVAAREAAVTATEDAIAASQIQIGTWTVGVDIQPGTYRTAEPVTSTCYWGIYRSGTNKADIIDNDIVEGGHPTVALSEGQDFENGCGVWDKQ